MDMNVALLIHLNLCQLLDEDIGEWQWTMEMKLKSNLDMII